MSQSQSQSQAPFSTAPPALLPFYPDVGEPAAPTYPTENLEPLSYELDPKGDGKTVYNPPRPDGKLSPYYDKLYNAQDAPNSKKWWDFHVYHLPNNPKHVKYAHQLYESVRREFPELRVYRVIFDRPLGPHPVPMFEVNVFTPAQLGTLLSWFVQNRGPCSVLVHPNTGDDVPDHTTNATWLGDKVPLDIDLLRSVDTMRAQDK